MWTNQQHTKDLGDKCGQFSDWNRGDACHILYSADLWKHCDWADWVCRTGTDAACMFVSADLLQTYHGRYQDSAYRGGKREKVTVQLTVDQTMLFPAAKVRYRVRCRNTFAGYARNFWWNGAGLMRGMQCMEKRVVLSHVGSYEYELVKVRIYDLTGLFYVHKKIKRFADIQVLPELDAVAVQVSERVRRYFGEAESYDDFQPGTDVSQIFDVREYRPGDRLQRIHWKLSAKSDGLLVREDSQPLACAVVFLLDMLPQMAGKGRHMRRSREAYAETFLTIAADLVYSMMDAGCPHYVAWQEETEIKRLRVEDEESVYLFLMQFMECQKETAGSLRQRYEQQYRCEHPVHRLELTPELFLVLDGQTLADFGGDNWRQKLEEMELVL